MGVYNIFSKLENPKEPLLGPNIFWLKFWGIIQPKRTIPKLLYLFIQTVSILFGLTEFIELYFVKDDINLLINNLKISITAAVSVYKIINFLMYQEKWLDLLDYANRVEIRDREASKTHLEMKPIINEYTKYSRRFSYTYWILVIITVILLILQPILKYTISSTYRYNVKNGIEPYEQIVSSWVPWDKNTLSGYIISYIYQVVVAVYALGLLMTFDSVAVVLMVFFGGQIDLLKCRCVRIFDAEDEELVRKQLIECHLIHKEMIRYAKLYDSLLSPVMFLFMFVCSVDLCASAFQIFVADIVPMQKFLTAEYLVFQISQLFVYCWHSNKVFYKSECLSRSPYEGNWYSKKTTLGKDIIIFTTSLKKNIIFTAGPFVNLTIPTFINIIRGAYSYYTILSR